VTILVCVCGIACGAAEETTADWGFFGRKRPEGAAFVARVVERSLGRNQAGARGRGDVLAVLSRTLKRHSRTDQGAPASYCANYADLLRSAGVPPGKEPATAGYEIADEAGARASTRGTPMDVGAGGQPAVENAAGARR